MKPSKNRQRDRERHPWLPWHPSLPQWEKRGRTPTVPPKAPGVAIIWNPAASIVTLNWDDFREAVVAVDRPVGGVQPPEQAQGSPGGSVAYASTVESQPLRRIAVFSPPGHWLLKLSEFLWSAQAHREVFVPLVRDMRQEYFEALVTGRDWLAKRRLLGGYWAFAAAALGRLPISLARWAVALWKVSGPGG